MAGNIKIKSIRLWVVLAALGVMGLQVPLADVRRAVAFLLQDLGKCSVPRWHVALHLRRGEHMARPHAAAATAVISEANPTGILTGENTGPRG